MRRLQPPLPLALVLLPLGALLGACGSEAPDEAIGTDALEDQLSAGESPPGFTIPEQLIPLVRIWTDCLSRETEARVDDGRSAPEVVKAIYAACDVEAADIDRVAIEQGITATGIMETEKALMFDRAVAVVEARRAGAPPPTSEGLWGACVGSQVQTRALEMPAERAADQALADCADFEEAVRQASLHLGEAYAEQNVREQRASLRDRALSFAQAAQARAEDE